MTSQCDLAGKGVAYTLRRVLDAAGGYWALGAGPGGLGWGLGSLRTQPRPCPISEVNSSGQGQDNPVCQEGSGLYICIIGVICII